ncbi:MAG: hypothetical protein HY606_01495, partial [Planctomycetes bacterium]|nr:hypothetical protein [Planctomycetota bacterium]
MLNDKTCIFNESPGSILSNIQAVGINYKTAPLDMMELLHVKKDEIKDLVSNIKKKTD